MRNRLWTRSVVWLLACATLLGVAGTMRFQDRPSMQTASQSRFTNASIVARAEPIVQALFQSAKRKETSALPITNYTAAGQSVHEWSLDSIDPISGDTAHLLLNDDTGELLRASRLRALDRAGRYNEPSSQREAVSLTWDWFHSLKIGRASEEWRVVAMRKKHFALWDMYLRSGDHCAVLTISTCSGQLVQAVCYHLPNAKMAWLPVKTKSAS